MQASSLLPSSPVALLVAALVSGCIIPKAVGDLEDTENGDSSGTAGEVGPTTVGMTDTTSGVSGASTEPTSTEGPDPTSDTDPAGSETGALFLMEPDGGTKDPECEIWTQDCPDGMKCMPWANDGGNAWNDTRCSPIADDPDAVGEPCIVEGTGTSGIDSCDAGAMCWDVDTDTNEGTCVSFCGGDEAVPICEEEGTACALTNDGVLILCLPICDPVIQDCVEGQACYPLADDFFCVPEGPVGMGGPGESCEDIAVCDPGLACVQPELVPDCASSSCCSAFCNLTDPAPPCLAGQVCTPWYEPGMAPEGYEDLGLCALPT